MIYLDNAATTKMSKTAINSMLPYKKTALNTTERSSPNATNARVVANCNR